MAHNNGRGCSLENTTPPCEAMDQVNGKKMLAIDSRCGGGLI